MRWIDRGIRAFGVGIVLLILNAFTHVAVAQLPAEVRGTVTDAHTGRAIHDARVELLGQTATTTSDGDGAFVLRGLDPRTYTFRVRAPGYAPYTADVTVENGRVATLDVGMAPVELVTMLAGVLTQGQRDTLTGGATVFDRATIEASGGRDVGELLRTTPGVVVTQSGGPGSPTTVSIRGSSARDVLVVVDGVPINSALTGEADLSRLSLAQVDRVTVLPGAQSARYGSRALAGVVAIETRRDASDVSMSTRVGALGERDGALSAGASHPTDHGTLLGSLNADYRKIVGDFGYEIPAVRGGGTADRLNAGMTSGGMLAAGSMEGEHATLGLRAGWQSVSRGMPGSIVQPSLSGREREDRANVAIDGQGNAGSFAWHATADVSHETERFVDPTPPYGDSFDDTVHATGFTGSADGKLLWGPSIETFGIDSRVLDVTSSMLDSTAPHVQRQFGAWVGVRGPWTSIGAVRLSAGAMTRVDWDTFLDGATVSPRVNVTLESWRLALEGSYGQGYAPPTLSDQFFHEGVQVQPNPNLKPERVRNDLDARITLRDLTWGALQTGASFNAYRNATNGLILWTPNFRFVWSPDNFDVHTSGWDLSGHTGVPSWGASLDATVSRNNATYAGPVLSGQVTYRPTTTANFLATLARDAGTMDVVTRFVGARRTVAGSSLNLLDPYWLTDVHVTHPLLRRRWRVDLMGGVDNVFDRPAAMLVDYPFPGRTWTLSLRATRGDERRSGALPFTP